MRTLNKYINKFIILSINIKIFRKIRFSFVTRGQTIPS